MAPPTEPVPRPIRPLFRTDIAILKPSPGSPSTFSAGTLTSLKCRRRRSFARRPIVSKRSPTSKPFIPFSRISAMCRSLPFTSQRANAVNTEPFEPLPMYRFSPFSTQEPSACWTARDSMFQASEPAFGSVSA